MRLIDAEKAVENIRKQQTKSIARECAINAVNNTPVEDVAPVVHAHWLYVELGTPTRWSYRCSNCDCLRLSGFPSEYCPYCGAKMDEGESE